MSSDPSEPSLAVRPRPAPLFLRRRFLRRFAPVASLAVGGLVALLVSANLLLPFERLVTLEGTMGAMAHLFNDDRVRDLLLRHHLRVNVIRQGSRDGATGDLGSLDFVFTSGQPAADLVVQRRRAEGKYYSQHKPYISPIVLATYREYAETLHAAGVATPQVSRGFDRPYYYTLDMAGFLGLVRAEKSWADLNGRAHGVANDNKVLAQTPSMCASNSGASYLGLVSYVVHGRVPATAEEAADFTNKIKSLLDDSLPLPAPEIYFRPEGRPTAPIIVLYEHQYLADQLGHRERSGELDDDHVLLYPNTAVQAQPQFVALNEDADRLGRLLITDPDLRRRALELGLRVLDPGRGTSSEQLSTLLAERGVPVPSAGSDTRAVLPDTPLLEQMISVGCPSVMPK
ncbi:MAG TPA: hypothetical protein VJT72_14905 [Pseudonocardiaceae bacterium]|nr:hypothetical protein [Pseudonocardiaceae bacterium]